MIKNFQIYIYICIETNGTRICGTRRTDLSFEARLNLVVFSILIIYIYIYTVFEIRQIFQKKLYKYTRLLCTVRRYTGGTELYCFNTENESTKSWTHARQPTRVSGVKHANPNPICISDR